MDCVFLVNGQKVTVAISCAALARLSGQDQVTFTDQQLVDIAARCLRRRLEEGYNPLLGEVFLGEDDLRDLGRELKFM